MPWVALALLLSAASASEQLAEAQRLYGALKYERALGVATSALTAPDLATGARAEAYLLIGLCRAQLGADDQARAAFAEALSLDASAKLPAGAPPKIRRLFEAERSRLPPPAPAPAVAPDAPALTPPPVLVPAPALPPRLEVTQPAAPEPLPRWPAFTAMGAGLAAGGAGTAFAFLARSQAEAAAQAEWADDRARLNGRAQTDATVANVLFVSGAVLLGAGLTYLVVEEVAR